MSKPNPNRNPFLSPNMSPGTNNTLRFLADALDGSAVDFMGRSYFA